MTSNLQSLAPLFARLREDGGRYLISVGLTPDETAAAENPTFGGKPTRRWLTDKEYAALCSLGSRVETSCFEWIESAKRLPTGDDGQFAGKIFAYADHGPHKGVFSIYWDAVVREPHYYTYWRRIDTPTSPKTGADPS